MHISLSADNKDIVDNITCAHSLLDSFANIKMEIRADYKFHRLKNPEYTINGLLADRKSVESVKGISAAFKKSLAQHCEVIVLDFDKHLKGKYINTKLLYSGINGRRNDFINSTIKECYIVRNNKAIKIDASFINSKGKFDLEMFVKEIKRLDN